MVKYLQLKLTKDLGTAEVNGETKHRHVTFLYFGKELASLSTVKTALEGIPGPTFLSNPRPVLMGAKKDIPAVAYDINNTELKQARLDIMQKHGKEVSTQNFKDWLPHISYMTMEEVEQRKLQHLLVVGVEANDQSWAMDLAHE